MIYLVGAICFVLGVVAGFWFCARVVAYGASNGNIAFRSKDGRWRGGKQAFRDVEQKAFRAGFEAGRKDSFQGYDHPTTLDKLYERLQHGTGRPKKN